MLFVNEGFTFRNFLVGFPLFLLALQLGGRFYLGLMMSSLRTNHPNSAGRMAQSTPFTCAPAAAAPPRRCGRPTADRADGCRDPPRRDGRGPPPRRGGGLHDTRTAGARTGRTLWLSRNTFSRSYRSFTAARRARFSSPNAARTRSAPSSPTKLRYTPPFAYG